MVCTQKQILDRREQLYVVYSGIRDLFYVLDATLHQSILDFRGLSLQF